MDRQASKTRLHCLLAVLDLVLPNPLRAGRHALHHVAVGVGEPHVVFEKVAVGQDVGDDQLVLDQRVAIQQKGVARVGVDHQLVDFAQIEVVLELHPVKGFAKAPMREPRRHAVRAKRVDDVSRAYLVAHRVKVKAKAFGDFRDFFNRALQFLAFVVGHVASPHFFSPLCIWEQLA